MNETKKILCVLEYEFGHVCVCVCEWLRSNMEHYLFVRNGSKNVYLLPSCRLFAYKERGREA